jgi:tetraacyldisaccharide 4'-kinase
VRAGLDRAGDEPLMLARSVAGAIVVVSPDRYLAGRLAELRLGATVHVLDDGFQHLPLARDVDLLIVSAADVRDGRVLPSGRLREPLDAARNADAVLVPDATEAEARETGDRLGVGRVFTLTRNTGEARWAETPRDGPERAGRGASVFAVAGVARPERFFDDVRLAGFTVAGTRAFRDHHPFTMRDVQAIAEAARQAGAGAIVTTEKDLMRLLPFQPFPMAVAWIPLETRIEPQDSFREWLQSRLKSVARASAVGAGAEAFPSSPAGVAGIRSAG